MILNQKRKTSIIVHDGVLTGSADHRSAECSAYAIWKRQKARYLDVLRKARPDLAEQVRHPRRVERRPPRREWHPKQPRADEKPSANVNMVFVLVGAP